MNKSTKVIIGLIVLIGLVAIAIGFNSFGRSGDKEKVIQPDDQPEAIMEAPTKELTENEKNEKNEMLDSVITEEEFIERIHGMSHQKVYSEVVYTITPISLVEIDKLIEALDRNEYNDENYYREVLKNWRNGDFTNAIEVHNKIWEEDAGEVGKATRFRTAEEENQFVQKHFSGYIESHVNEKGYEIIYGIGE